ncbi:hypothetical protein [Streptomyces sp. NBC_01187]|uniref:hypothetical protein n=1 Tax=Streptomyces sp. NBC_01187 TaxID=2903766 RepID=UPI00386B3C72|nr:hypothetical protein OG220_32735 [Streptomyces sp. NBC_01187]
MASSHSSRRSQQEVGRSPATRSNDAIDIVALAEEALRHQERLPRERAPSVSTVGSSDNEGQSQDPWYHPATKTWHCVQGSTVYTAFHDRAQQAWKWGVDHPDHVSAVISATTLGSLAVGALAQPPAEQTMNWATVVKGFGGISLGALVPLHQWARTENPTWAQRSAATLNAVGQGVFGLGLTGLVQNRTAAWAAVGFGPLVAAVTSGAYPWLARQPAGLPYSNQEAAAYRLHSSAASHLAGVRTPPGSPIRENIPLADLQPSTHRHHSHTHHTPTQPIDAQPVYRQPADPRQVAYAANSLRAGESTSSGVRRQPLDAPYPPPGQFQPRDQQLRGRGLGGGRK